MVYGGWMEMGNVCGIYVGFVVDVEREGVDLVM